VTKAAPAREGKGLVRATELFDVDRDHRDDEDKDGQDGRHGVISEQ
jgi:hypothetical protein